MPFDGRNGERKHAKDNDSVGTEPKSARKILPRMLDICPMPIGQIRSQFAMNYVDWRHANDA